MSVMRCRSSPGAAGRARSYDLLATLRAWLEQEARMAGEEGAGHRRSVGYRRGGRTTLSGGGSRGRLGRPQGRRCGVRRTLKRAGRRRSGPRPSSAWVGSTRWSAMQAAPSSGELHELPEEDWDDGFDVNLKGIYRCVRSAWAHLADVGWNDHIDCLRRRDLGLGGTGCLLRNESRRDHAHQVSWRSKGAREGIRANCVCPGFTDTPLLQTFMAAAGRSLRRCAKRRWGSIRWVVSERQRTLPTRSSS